MNNAETRQAIATAISTIDGLKGYAQQPSATKNGDGWPQWRGAQRDGLGGAFFNVWNVYVLLPSDEIKADEWADQYETALFLALEKDAMSVDSIEPFLLKVNNTDTNALMITGRSE